MTQSIPDIFDMTGRVALITGAARGIGLEMARTLAVAGCAVAIQDIDHDVAKAEADAINANGGKAISLRGDVLDLSLPPRLVADVVAQLGGLHVMINNASIQIPKPWMQTTPEEIEKQLRANLVSPIVFIQQVWPIFKQQRYGRIINLGSVQQRRVNPGMLAYSLSKGAMEKFTMGLFEEMAAANVTINQIAPGWINTYRNRKNLSTPQILAENGKKHVPIGRIGDPRDFRGIVLLLCSEAGSYITGENIFVDGGMKHLKAMDY